MVIRGFHTELEAVYEEYNIGIAKDFRKVYTALFELLYQDTPTAHRPPSVRRTT